MTLDLNIFNLQRYPNDVDDVVHTTLNQVDDFSYNKHVDEFDTKYESFMDNETEYNIFDFDEMCL